jgi:uncharacterized membrane protein HdeD (DUF308 family)
MAAAGVHTTEDARAELLLAERFWYLFVVTGLFSFVVGVILLLDRHASVKLLGVLIGLDLLFAGVTLLARGLSSDRDDDASPAATLLLGTLALVAGVIVVRNPGESLVVLVLALAIYLIVAGALALSHALVRPKGRTTALVKGIVFVAAGTVIVSWPEITSATLAVLAGIALCLQGAVEIAEGLILRHHLSS